MFNILRLMVEHVIERTVGGGLSPCSRYSCRDEVQPGEDGNVIQQSLPMTAAWNKARGADQRGVGVPAAPGFWRS